MPDESKSTSGIALAKLWLEAIQAACTIAALLGALWWFRAQRSTMPVMRLEQTLTQRRVADASGNWLVGVDVRVTNVSKVAWDLSGGTLQIYQVNPVPGKDLLLKEEHLDNVHLEPGESDQAIFNDYQIPERIKTLQFSVKYPRRDMQASFWSVRTFFDVGKDEPSKTVTASSPESQQPLK